MERRALAARSRDSSRESVWCRVREYWCVTWRLCERRSVPRCVCVCVSRGSRRADTYEPKRDVAALER